MFRCGSRTLAALQPQPALQPRRSRPLPGTDGTAAAV